MTGAAPVYGTAKSWACVTEVSDSIVLLPFEAGRQIPSSCEHQSRLLHSLLLHPQLFFLRESDALLVLPGGFPLRMELSNTPPR